MSVKTSTWCAILLFVAAAMAAGWRLWTASRGTDFFSDDAYYYAVAARNFVDSGRLTFDGTTLTNGFHPLLLGLEIALYAVIGTSHGPAFDYLVLLAAVATIYVGTLGAVLWKLVRMSRLTESSLPLAVALIMFSVLLTPRFTAVYLNGMESVLELPLLAALAWAMLRSRWMLAGWCGAILALARLDTLPFIILPLTLLCAWNQARSGGSPVRVAVQLTAPALLSVGLLVLAYHGIFEHALPISGAIKSTFPLIHFQPGNLIGNSEERLGLRVSILGAVLGILLLLRPGILGSTYRRTGLISGLLSLLQAVALVLFQRWSKATPSWYLGAMLPLGVLAGAIGMANRFKVRSLERLAMVAVLGAIALNVCWMAGVSGRLGTPTGPSLPTAKEHQGAMLDLLRFVESRPPGQRWAATDCGKLAFWSRRTFVNLDGLVNDFGYQEHLRDQELTRYLGEHGVRYLVIGAWDLPVWEPNTAGEPIYHHRVAPQLFSGEYQAYDFYLYSYVFSKFSERIRIPRSAELWRSEATRDGRAMAKFVVFDLDLVRRPNGSD
ncbi:MAG: hypothetical protein ABIS67_09185 [Candidatus Eisenbacteria bacterium]